MFYLWFDAEEGWKQCSEIPDKAYLQAMIDNGDAVFRVTADYAEKLDEISEDGYLNWISVDVVK